MPRLIAQRVFDNHDAHLNQALAGVEVAGTSYLVATNPMQIELPLMGRCAVAGVLWYLYESMLLSPTSSA